MERKEGVWSKRRVSFRTSLMRNNNVAYTSTPSGCRLYPLYSSGVFFFSSTRVLLSMAIYTHYYFASATDQNEKNCTRIARIRVSLENWRNERSFVACFAHPSILSCRNDKMMKLQTIQIVRFPFQFKKKKKKIIINISGKILLNYYVVSDVKNSKKQRREKKNWKKLTGM